MKRIISTALLIGFVVFSYELYSNPIIAITKLSGSMLKQTFYIGRWFLATPFRAFFSGVGTTAGAGYGILTEDKRKNVHDSFVQSFFARKSSLENQVEYGKKQLNNTYGAIKSKVGSLSK